MIKTTDLGRFALDEADSKEFLSRYEIPIAKGYKAKDANEALIKSEQLGFPVVAKGLGRRLMHKTDMGLVYVNIPNASVLLNVLKRIEEKAGDLLEGFYIQQYIEGKHEWVFGMIRDELFGPAVMFGVGGIYTEVFNDVALRLAPLTEQDCRDMLQELRCKMLIEGVRGEKPVNLGLIFKTLIALSQIAIENPDIVEIDINPLIQKEDGSMVAVDSLIIKSSGTSKDNSKTKQSFDLEKFFSPESIVFVGASSQLGKWGHILPSVLLGGGYNGRVYFVNPKGGRIAEQNIYTSVLDMPGQVDLAVITIPAQTVSSVLPDLNQKGIKNILVISSGFSEVGEDGRELEENLVSKAKEFGMTLVGPNLMGLCNPYKQLNMTIFAQQPDAGSVAVISQSGNMAVHLMSMFKNNGIGISSVCANGNEAMVKTENFLDYFYNDKKTDTITAYVEKVNGKEFFDQCKKLTSKKPFILLKGGQSEAGFKAAASHTGGMASDARFFDTACKQSGVIQVGNVAELTDLSAAFAHLPLPKGKRVAIITMGGGFGVITADQCEKNGLLIPKLSENLIFEFNKYFPPFWSRANPVDMVNDADKTIPFKVMEAMANWDECDAIIHLGLFGQGDLQKLLAEAIRASDASFPDAVLNAVKIKSDAIDDMVFDYPIELMKKYGKPIVGVGSWISNRTTNIVYKKNEDGLATVMYPTPERAVYSIAKLYEYAKYRGMG